jgi:hypothetical protein
LRLFFRAGIIFWNFFPLSAAIFYGEHRRKRISAAHERSELAKQSGLKAAREPYFVLEKVDLNLNVVFLIYMRPKKIKYFSVKYPLAVMSLDE